MYIIYLQLKNKIMLLFLFIILFIFLLVIALQDYILKWTYTVHICGS